MPGRSRPAGAVATAGRAAGPARPAGEDVPRMKTAKDEPNTPLILVFGVVSAILTFVLVVLLQGWFSGEQTREFYRKTVAPRSSEKAAALTEQAAQLTGYRWVDRQEGIVAIPIERAMELVVREAPDGPAAGAVDAGADADRSAGP